MRNEIGDSSFVVLCGGSSVVVAAVVSFIPSLQLPKVISYAI